MSTEYQVRLSEKIKGGESGSIGDLPLLKTKLYPPPVTPDLVSRYELLERLEKNRHRPLTLISAPAGYGKSILASMWLHTSSLPGGWVSLDDTDNNLHTFVSYLLAAIQTAVPHTLLQTQILLKAFSLPHGANLARHLLADLDQIETPFLLILDDIHCIHEQSIFDFLEALLSHPSPVLHLVLIGRQDPSLPIASLRAYQRITEVRSRDLRFSTDETSRFLQQMLNRPISEEIAFEWTKNTGGWAVALRLAVLFLGHHSQSANLGGKPPGENQFLQEYLMTEVLARLPLLLQSWLLKTALLDRFCAPLCEAVCLETDSDDRLEMTGETFIQWLQTSNLFLINLDQHNEWFRFHDIFRTYLRNMLEKQLSYQEISDLHLGASQWFAENGMGSEAIQHALAAHDTSTAVEIFARYRRLIMNAEHWSELDRWVRLFPDDVVEKEPVLLLTRAYLPIAYSDNYGFTLEILLTSAIRLLMDMPEDYPLGKELWAEVFYFNGLGALMEGQSETTISAGDKMIDALPVEAFYLRMQAHALQAIGYQMSGNIKQGTQIIQEALSAPDWPVNIRAKGFFNLALLYFMEADLNSAQTLFGESIKVLSKHYLDAYEASYFAGMIYYLCNDITLAKRYFVPVVENSKLVDPVVLSHAVRTLARIYHTQKQPEKANAIFQQTWSYLEEINNQFALNILKTVQVELALDQGDAVHARQLSLTLSIDWRLPTWIWHYYTPRLSPIKLWLAEGEDLERILTLLEELDKFLLKMNRKIHRIDVLALQALAYQALDNQPKAMEKLGQSVALAASGKFIRNYLDLGPKMRELLTQLYKQKKTTEGTDDLPYLAQILGAFPPVKLEDQKSVAPSVIPIDPLTKRELEVLKLLATDLSTREIAERLVITWPTTRTHIKNSYAKLGAHSRYEAVERAKELGII